MTYKFLEHTADVMFEAEGKTLEELFIECSKALNETIYGDIGIIEQEVRAIEIKAEDIEGLLYKFLEEFLFLLDAEGLIFKKVENLEFDKEEFTLTAKLIGDKAENYHFTNDVKAITSNNLKIENNKKVYKSKMVLDV